jgi:hypothetical protein
MEAAGIEPAHDFRRTEALASWRGAFVLPDLSAEFSSARFRFVNVEAGFPELAQSCSSTRVTQRPRLTRTFAASERFRAHPQRRIAVRRLVRPHPTGKPLKTYAHH